MKFSIEEDIPSSKTRKKRYREIEIGSENDGESSKNSQLLQRIQAVYMLGKEL